MLHDGRSTIANVEPSTLVPAVVIESMSSWVSRLCSQADGEDVLNAFAYSSAFHPHVHGDCGDDAADSDRRAGGDGESGDATQLVTRPVVCVDSDA